MIRKAIPLLFISCYSLATIGIVQKTARGGLSSCASKQIALTVSATGSGNLIHVTAGACDTTQTVQSVTDNATGGSNIYFEVPNSRATSTGVGCMLDSFYTTSSKPGATTITVTYTNQPAWCSGPSMVEYSGVTTGNPVDVSGVTNNGNTAADNKVHCSSITITNASDVVVNSAYVNSNITSVDNPFTLENSANIFLADYKPGATGSYGSTFVDQFPPDTFMCSLVAYLPTPPSTAPSKLKKLQRMDAI